MATAKLDFKKQGEHVLVALDGELMFDLHWQAAVEKGEQLLADARNPDLERVVTNTGRVLMDLEKSAARDLGTALIAAGRLIEEITKAEAVALDSAILVRAGCPFTLAMHPKIVEMANLEASHNRALRRAMPSIQSQSAVGVPGLIQETA